MDRDKKLNSILRRHYGFIMTALLTTEPNTEYIFAQLAVIIYHLLIESEVITGKSQTEALMY